MRIFNLCLIIGMTLIGGGTSFATEVKNLSVSNSEAASGDSAVQIKEIDLNKESPQYGYDLLGCAATRFDCQRAARDYGYLYYAVNRDFYTCRDIFYPYACYGGW